MNDGEKNNVFSLVQDGADSDEETLPVNTYRLVDIDDNDYYDDGFLIFTQTHVAVMKETKMGALPVLLLTNDRLKFAEVVPDEED